MKNVGKAQDARISAFRFGRRNEGRIGDPGMGISAYSVVTIIVLLSPESGEEACASQLLVDPLLRFSSLVFAPQLHSLAALLNKLGHQSRPPGLVARPDASPIVAMKELVKIDEVAPVCIVLKFI